MNVRCANIQNRSWQEHMDAPETPDDNALSQKGLMAAFSVSRQGIDSYDCPLYARRSRTRHAKGLIIVCESSPASAHSLICCTCAMLDEKPSRQTGLAGQAIPALLMATIFSGSHCNNPQRCSIHSARMRC